MASLKELTLMSIEDKLEENTAAVKANTEEMKALRAALGSGGSTSTGTTGKGSTTTTPKITADALRALAGQVREKHGKPTTVALIKEVGGAAELAAVAEKNFAKLAKALEAKLAEDVASEDGTDDEL